MRQRLFSILICIILLLYFYANYSLRPDPLVNHFDTSKIRELIDTALILSASDYTMSLYFLDEAKTLTEKINYKKGIGDVYYVSSRVYYYKDEYQIAISYLNKAKNIYKDIESSEGLGKYYFGLGSIELLYGNDIKAIEAFQKALKIEEVNNNINGIVINQNALAVVNIKKKNYGLALEYSKNTLNNKNKIKDESLISNALVTIGRIYKEIDSLSLAKKYCLEALKLRQNLKDNRKIASSLYELGTIYNLNNEPLEAINRLNLALEIFKTLEEKTGEVICLIELSKAFQKLEQMNNSKNAVKKVLKILK